MVQHGLFGLGLVRAETGGLYLEHGDPSRVNEIYAEVEPDDEFYLQLRSDAPEVVYADLSVDGTLIEKGHRVWTGPPSKVGIIRSDSTAGERTTKEVALRFARAKVHDGLREDAAAYWTGQVEATFYGNSSYRIPPGSPPTPYSKDGAVKPENNTSVGASRHGAAKPIENATVAASAVNRAAKVTYAPRQNTFYLNPSLASTDVGYVPGKSAENQKKGVKSAEGTTALREHNLKWNRSPLDKKKKLDTGKRQGGPIVKEPERLGSITLRYCSTVGLIHAGILAKPPNWDVELLNATSAQERKVLSKVKVEKFELKSETINGRGEKVVENREVELFDLTEE